MPKRRRGLKDVRDRGRDLDPGCLEATVPHDKGIKRSCSTSQTSLPGSTDTSRVFVNENICASSVAPAQFMEASADVACPSIESSHNASYHPVQALSVAPCLSAKNWYVMTSTDNHPNSASHEHDHRQRSELRFREDAYAALETKLLETKALYEKRLSLRDDIIRSVFELQQHTFDSDAHMYEMWEKAEDKSQKWKSRFDRARRELANDDRTTALQSASIEDLRLKQRDLELAYLRLEQSNAVSEP